MKPITLRLIANVFLLAALLAWMYGGARAGLYHTYYTVTVVDPITTLESEQQVNRFLPGSETLAVGFALFALLQIVSGYLESRRPAQILT